MTTTQEQEKKTDLKPQEALPRVKGWPLVGSGPAVFNEPLNFFGRLAKEYGDMALYYTGPIPILFINSPELVHELLVERAQDFDKGKVQRDAFGQLVGKGLLTSEGKLHQQQRKLMAPAFTPRRLSSYADTMVAFADRNQADWQEGQILNVNQEMMRLTMSIVSKVLLGIELTADDEMGRAMQVGIEWVQLLMQQPIHLPLFVPTPRNHRTREGLNLIRQRVQNLIDERRTKGEDTGDLLSLLLLAQDEQGQGMSDQQVYDEVVTIFLAGHETTAQALTWTFHLLGQHPDLYRKLQEEVDTVLEGRLPTYVDLNKLPYTLQVLKEAMRIYPPSSVIIRHAIRDTELGGYKIRKNSWVTYSQYILHRRPDNFPDPERFDPERFAPENEQKLPRYAYTPFGAGHRICIGNHFATMEGHLLLATLAQKVSFEALNDFPVTPELVVTLRPKNGLKMKVKRR
jgi:cytochrome P450